MTERIDRPVSRRGFLLTTGTGAAVAGLAAAAGWQAYRRYGPGRPGFTDDLPPLTYVRKEFTGKCVEDPDPKFALPGRFPGKVIEVHDPGSVRGGVPQYPAIVKMLDQGMAALTGAPSGLEAWRSFFQKGDRVGIKVNPVGFAREPGNRRLVGSISNFATIVAIVEALKQVGLGHRDFLLFERYAEEFRAAGYEDFLARELPGVGWVAAGARGGDVQTDMEGRDPDGEGRRPDPEPHVVGYDPDVFQKFDYASDKHNANDRLSFESHVTRILTGELVNKVITIPLLKDHRSAGITMALKNMSHGMVNNVARTHAGPGRAENRCGTFIPHVVALEPIRRKNVLHIADALIAVYEGGPGTWNNSWGTWERKSLFLATDPVAMDHVGWDILDAERAARGWAPVARMGVAGNNRSGTEAFYLRQPEHVELAGSLGLGVFDPARIEYRRLVTA
jgi:hypothetical protein